MRLLWVFWFLSLAGITEEATVVCQDGTQLLNPDTSVLSAVPQKYWKCGDTNADGGTDAIISMTQAEQDALNQQVVQGETLRQQWKTELDTLGTQLESDDTSWSGLTTAQKLAVIKKVLRREVLRKKLGE